MYDNKTIIKLHFDGVSIRQIAERSKNVDAFLKKYAQKINEQNADFPIKLHALLASG